MAALYRRLVSLVPKVISSSRSNASHCITRAVRPVICGPDQDRRFSIISPLSQKEKVTINFILEDGEKHTVKAKVGDNLLDVVLDNDVDIDGFGACEGTLACSTCHLIFTPSQYETIEGKPTDEEMDMLDLAYGLTDTSRLGCQVIVTKDMDGWEVRVPEGVADARDV